MAIPLDSTNNTNHTHKWKLYLKPILPETCTLIDKVEFKLHESFINPKRAIKSPPYEVEETGWGEFEILITIYFSTQEKVVIKHMLQLYPTQNNKIINGNQVLSEKYDEFVFSNDLPTVSEVELLSAENLEKEQRELDRIQECHEKVLAEYEIRKMEIARLEEELKILGN